MKFFKKLFRSHWDQESLLTKRKDEPDVYHFDSEEERINAATEKARLTFDYFKSSLASPLSHQQYFSLKAKIEDGDMVEHIWLTDVTFDETDNFFGKIGNEPLSVKNVKIDQQVGIPFEKVSDWMIIEDGRLIGGYTIRAIRETMTDKEKKSFDKNTGMHIDEGIDYFRHDHSTPEGAILCLEDAYDARDIDRAVACKDFYEEAKLMLTRTANMKRFLDDEEIIIQTGEALKLSFIKSMQDGFPDFTNVTRAFPKREFFNEYLVIITEVCFHPDGRKSTQRLYVSKKDGEWKVLSLAD